MSIETMGSTIAALRKEKNVTQEELADYVGVSAQAVSKWEKGGAPDCALLPSIADFFEVSIDRLFGRKATDYMEVEEALATKIMDTPYNEKLDYLYHLCWNIQIALFGQSTDKHKLITIREDNKSPDMQILSEFHNGEGYTLVGVDSRNPYFMLIPQIPMSNKLLANSTDLCTFFKFLSDRTIFDAMVLLCRHPYSQFTIKPFADKLKIDENKANEVLDFLIQYGCLAVEQVEIDYEIRTVYRCCKEELSAFAPILILTQRFLGNNKSYYFYNGGTAPILK